VILPVLDFSTIKNELFPVIATIFSKTNSLTIKVRGLQAFVILCGGSNDPEADDGLDGFGTETKKTSSSTALDKYTMQEKIVPLVKAIKTKEPGVMIAALMCSVSLARQQTQILSPWTYCPCCGA
jgi:SCY1-like protein 2